MTRTRFQARARIYSMPGRHQLCAESKARRGCPRVRKRIHHRAPAPAGVRRLGLSADAPDPASQIACPDAALLRRHCDGAPRVGNKSKRSPGEGRQSARHDFVGTARLQCAALAKVPPRRRSRTVSEDRPASRPRLALMLVRGVPGCERHVYVAQREKSGAAGSPIDLGICFVARLALQPGQLLLRGVKSLLTFSAQSISTRGSFTAGRARSLPNIAQAVYMPSSVETHQTWP